MGSVSQDMSKDEARAGVSAFGVAWGVLGGLAKSVGDLSFASVATGIGKAAVGLGIAIGYYAEGVPGAAKAALSGIAGLVVGTVTASITGPFAPVAGPAAGITTSLTVNALLDQFAAYLNAWWSARAARAERDLSEEHSIGSFSGLECQPNICFMRFTDTIRRCS